jgi:hypothetical protein
MPVATMLAIAASFWSSHNFMAAQPVTWSWFNEPQSRIYPYQYSTYGYTFLNSYHINLNRWFWDRASNRDRCAVVIHEFGHAAFGFQHTEAGIMAPDATVSTHNSTPGACLLSRQAWRYLR